VNALVLLPLLVPLATAIACLLAWRHRRIQRAVGLAGACALLAAAVALLLAIRDGTIHAVQVGGWEAPWGITLVADLLSGLMLVLGATLGLLVVVYSLGSIDARREAFAYYPLLHLILAGLSGIFLAGDLFNLFVWFEVMLIASFVLLTLGGERAQLAGGLKYIVLNLLSSLFLLSATGLVYGLAGTLNLADLATKLPAGQPLLLTAVAMLFLVAFGIKSAIFPLFTWLPASYPAPPTAVVALFAGILTKTGIYALLRTFPLLFAAQGAQLRPVLLVLAGLTMVSGVLGAVAQMETRRLLSFHIVSQIGYLLMGLALLTPAGLAGSIVFMAHIVLAKPALFLVGGLAERVRGTSRLDAPGGLYAAHPVLAVGFLIPALSLAGIPPFSGFFGKLVLIEAGLAAGSYAIVAAALVVSALTLYSMVKIWTRAYWAPGPEAARPAVAPPGPLLWAPPAVLAALMIALGVGAEPLVGLAQDAAAQLLEPARYVEAVLGRRP
jgi:multicomponent Na+:H+ antiporter subunit D